MSELFPEANIEKEKLAGLVMSIIAWKTSCEVKLRLRAIGRPVELEYDGRVDPS